MKTPRNWVKMRNANFSAKMLKPSLNRRRPSLKSFVKRYTRVLMDIARRRRQRV